MLVSGCGKPIEDIHIRMCTISSIILAVLHGPFRESLTAMEVHTNHRMTKSPHIGDFFYSLDAYCDPLLEITISGIPNLAK